MACCSKELSSGVRPVYLRFGCVPKRWLSLSDKYVYALECFRTCSPTVEKISLVLTVAVEGTPVSAVLLADKKFGQISIYGC